MGGAMRREVAIVSWASFETPSEPARNEVEMLLPVIQEALGNIGLTQNDIGFTVSGSSDYASLMNTMSQVLQMLEQTNRTIIGNMR